MELQDLRPLKCSRCDWGQAGEMERNLLVLVSCNCSAADCEYTQEIPLCPEHALLFLMPRVLNQQTAQEVKGRSKSEYDDLLDGYDEWVAQGRPDREDESPKDFMLPEIDL